ncbi:MAG: hypothetical protein B7Y99_05665 [Caulobacterales bacterium 32-69-10]|nr:MAG: hypothetical protein B7Y99_05665 [Caulobacterales bacterium 32-69-10]
MTLIVCPLSKVEAVIAERAPSHLITLLDPAFLIDTPAGLEPSRHLRLGVNNIVEATEGRIVPDEALVTRIVAFGRDWDARRPMLIHCWAGISRSTATAFVLACERNPQTAEAEIAAAMRTASLHAYPNRRIVALADDLLGRGGRMVDAVEAMGPAPMVDENRPFELKALWR